MRSLAAAILLLVWTTVPVGTAAVRLFAKPLHCHCPGHKLPTGPAYAPCSTSVASAVTASLVLFTIPAAVLITRQSAQEYLDTYLPPKSAPRADLATPPPQV